MYIVYAHPGQPLPTPLAHNVPLVHYSLGQELLYARCKGVPGSPHCDAPGRTHGGAGDLAVVPKALVKGKALQLLGVELAQLVLRGGGGEGKGRGGEGRGGEGRGGTEGVHIMAFYP